MGVSNKVKARVYRSRHPEKVQKTNYIQNRRPQNRWRSLRGTALRRGLEFNLPLEEFCEIIKNSCHYCESPLPETGGGIDRRDNSKGYISGNCLPCCLICNMTKGKYISYEEMLQLMILRSLSKGAQ